MEFYIFIAVGAVILLGIGIHHFLMKECVSVDPCFPFLKGDLGYEKLDSDAKRKVLVVVDFQRISMTKRKVLFMFPVPRIV